MLLLLKLSYHFKLGLSFYGFGCCKSDDQLDSQMNILNLAECERQCLIDPECISFETSEEHYNGTFSCRNQVGSGRNFRVECDLNLDQQNRKCYKRDKSSN